MKEYLQLLAVYGLFAGSTLYGGLGFWEQRHAMTQAIWELEWPNLGVTFLLQPPRRGRVDSPLCASVVSCFAYYAPLSSRRMMPVLAASSLSTSASSLLPLISTGSPPIQKYGTPVGVVILPNKDIQPFRQAIQEALPHLKRIHYRGVVPCTSRDNDYKQIHVQTEVAAAIGDGIVHLIEFIKNCGGEFIQLYANSRCCENKQ